MIRTHRYIQQLRFTRSLCLSTATLLVAGCTDPLGPDPLEPGAPRSAEVGSGVSGLGAIGPGAPIPGSDRQEFAFAVSGTVGGTVTFSDYGVIRNGVPGRIIADPVADPPTGVTSYEQLSVACVRFGGTGRLDTGQLWVFSVDVCDSAALGVGFDTFSITLPDRVGPGEPYVRSGTLTAGDIVVSGSAGLVGLPSP